MIKRTRYPKEFREALVAEITLGQSTIAQVSERENIAGQTLRNWIDDSASGKTGSEQQEIAALKRKINQLAESSK
jgi:transposase-like protein